MFAVIFSDELGEGDSCGVVSGDFLTEAFEMVFGVSVGILNLLEFFLFP